MPEEEIMFVKQITSILLTAGVVMLAVSGILPALALAPEANAPSGGHNPDGPLAATSHLGGEIQISLPTTPESDRYRPSVAYNWRHDEYLVVWHNTWPGGHRDIYGRRVSESGQLLSWFSVSAGANDRAQPAVAYNATTDQYLVVWMYNANGDGSTYEIWGRTIAWNGAYQNPEFQIIAWPNRTFWTPRVAWSSLHNEYLVVWSAHDATTLVPTDIAHALLAADGSKLFGTIISSAQEPHQVDVTYNVAADEYLVVWRRMWAPADGDIRAARIHAGPGTVVDPPGVFTVNAVTEDQMLPAVATNQQHRYMVVWQHAYPGPCCDWDIRGQELDVNGNLVGSVFSIASSTDDETSPAIVARPGPVRDYLAVWQRSTSAGEDIWAYHRNDANIEAFQIASTAFWDHGNPAVAWGQVASLIVYAGDSQGDPTVYRHIYGRRWVPNAVFLPLVLRQ
jgi:hypothetical protein